MGFCVCSMFNCTLLCILSSFAIIMIGKRELVALLMAFFCYCSVALLPPGAMGWSAVCDCGIIWSYSLAFFLILGRLIYPFSQKKGLSKIKCI